ncbi:hypothetical protein TEH_23260, partial [Calderihabitans maritimus]
QTRAASPAVDFHHQVNAHAGRTKKNHPQAFINLFIKV